MRLFKTSENEGVDSPTPSNNEAKMPHCRMYNPMMELNMNTVVITFRASVVSGSKPIARVWLRFYPIYFWSYALGCVLFGVAME